MTFNEVTSHPVTMFSEEEREILRKLSSTMNKIDELNQAIQRLSDKLDDAKYTTIKFNEEAKKFDWGKETQKD